MHIQVETKELLTLLESVSKVSTKHLTLPVLQCVLLEAQNEELCVKATNIEIGIEGKVKVITHEEGVVAVPAHILLQTVNLITQKTVTLTTEGEVLHVETDSSKTEIRTIPVEDFPKIPRVADGAHIIKGPLFALGVRTAAFAASQSSIKPELGSVYVFQKKEHTLSFVATDSFRLVEKTVSQQGLVFQDAILIPYKNALELARVAGDAVGDVTLSVTENQCAITAGNIYITSRLTNGTFPDYTQIIPKEYQTHVTVLVGDMVHALKKTNIFLNKFMQLTLTVTAGSLTFSAESGELGTTTESIPATLEGAELTLSFNHRYVNEIMSHVADDSITLHFAGIGRPMVMQGVQDTTLRYLVMPMNK